MEKLWERWPLLLEAPGAPLAIALFVAAAALLALALRGRTIVTDRSSVPPLLSVVALGVLCVAALEPIAHAVWTRFSDIAWWRVALPIAVAAIGLSIVGIAEPRGVRRRGEPAGIGLRRSWSSFVERPILWGVGVLIGLTLLTTLLSGLASSPDDQGRFVVIDFGQAGISTFYGWAYGIPVLVSLVAVVAGAVVALSRIAARPFSHPDAVAVETRSRRRASRAVLAVTGSAVALAWGTALAMIGQAGAGSAGVGIPGVGDFLWTPGYASFASFFVGVGWMLQVVAFLGLLAVVGGAVSIRRSRRASASARRRTREVA